MSNLLKLFATCLLSMACGASLAADATPKTFDARAREIAERLDANQAQLDSAYNFAPFTQSGSLFPVLVAASYGPTEKPCASTGCVIKKPARPYCKAVAVNGACDPVTWRDYLLKGLTTHEPSLSAHDADARLDANFAELHQDLKGMMLFSTFVDMGLVTPPMSVRK